MHTHHHQGIPSVIVLDAKTGKYITDNARTEVMQSSNSDETKKALVQTWLSKEAVPVEQAVFSSGSSDNLLVKIVSFIAKRPAYIFAFIYFFKQLMRWLEEMGKDGDGEGEL